MARWRMPVVALTVVSLVLGTLTAGATPPAPVQAAAPRQAAPVTVPTGSEKVTLITGDQVTYRFTADGTPVDADVTAARREDGRPVVFTQLREGDQYYVFPSDATDLVTAGRLDRRLFDVSYLTKNGYTDSKASSLPLILQYGAATARAATAADALPATSNARALTSIRGAAVSVAKNQTGSFWAAVDTPSARSLDAGVAKVWLDGKVQASLDVSVPQIGAPEAWQAGYTGKASRSPYSTLASTRRTRIWSAGSRPRRASSPERPSPTATATGRTSPTPSSGPARLRTASTRASRRTPPCWSARC